MHADALQRLGLPDGQRNMAVPGIASGLLYLQVLGLECVLTVEVHPQCVALDGVGVLLSLAERTQGVGRAAEAGDVTLAVLGPAHGVGELLGAAQGLGVEEVAAVERDAREDAVVELVLDVVDVLGVAGGLEHAPREEHHANLGTNLVVGSLLRQLELAAVGLVDLLDGGLVVGGSVGRDTIVQGTAAAHDVNLVVDNVVPDGGEVPHELSLARLGIEVGDTGIEVVGAYGVSHGLVLVAELVAVLVVVLAVGHAVADGYQPLGQRQVFLVARLAVYLGGTHVVAGTDGVARQLGSVVGQEVVKEVGSLLAALEERGLACGALVYDAGGNEVPEVIGLEVQTRGKGVFLVLANLNACRILLDGMRVNACIAFGNDYWRVDVAIGTLGQCHLLDELVHQGVQLRVLGDGIDCGAGLEPFVHVAVMEWRPVVLALS